MVGTAIWTCRGRFTVYLRRKTGAHVAAVLERASVLQLDRDPPPQAGCNVQARADQMLAQGVGVSATRLDTPNMKENDASYRAAEADQLKAVLGIRWKWTLDRCWLSDVGSTSG